MQLIAEGVHDAPEIADLEREDHVGVGDRARLRLVQRMARREVHPPALIDHARLQRFGELDEVRHAGRRACDAICHDDGMLRGDEQARRFRDRA